MTDITALILAFGTVYAGPAAYALLLIRAGRAAGNGHNGRPQNRGRRQAPSTSPGKAD